MEVQERAEALEPAHSPTDTEATLPATRVNPSYLPEPVYPWKPKPTSPLLTISKPPIMKAGTNRGLLSTGSASMGRTPHPAGRSGTETSLTFHLSPHFTISSNLPKEAPARRWWSSH